MGFAGNWIVFFIFFVGIITLILKYEWIIPPINRLLRKIFRKHFDQLEKTESVTKGQRIAGFLFLMNAASCVFFMFKSFNIFMLITYIPAILISLVVGITLLSGVKYFINFAAFISFLGILVVLFASFRFKSVYMLLPVLSSIGILLLLIGDAMKRRIAAGVVLYVIPLLLFLTTDIQNIYEKSFQTSFYVESQEYGYKAGPLKSYWNLVNKEDIVKIFPDSDRCYAYKKYDGMILFVSDKYEEDQVVKHKVFKEINLEKLGNIMKISNIQDFGQADFNTTTFNAEVTANGMDIKYKIGLFSYKNKAIKILCFSTLENYPKLTEEFAEVLNSFEFVK